MTATPPNRDGLANLLIRMIDGELTANEHAVLVQRLNESRAARDLYREIVLDHAILRWRQCPMQSEFQPEPARAPRRYRSYPIPRFVLALAAALVLIATAWFMMPVEPQTQRQTQPQTADSSQGTSSPVAMLSDVSADAVFADSSAPMNPGNDLSPGPIKLLAGKAQIMFKSTAVVDLAGPCEFEMTGPNQGRLSAGMLNAFVPEHARGFFIDLPDEVRVTDLGTNFDVNVQDSRSEIHVLDGIVFVTVGQDPQIQSQQVHTGATVYIESGVITKMARIDTTVFNAASNRVDLGDDPPGQAIDFHSSPLIYADQRIEQAFGSVRGGIEPGCVLFASAGVADNGDDILGNDNETVDFIEWTTRQPIRLGGYRVLLEPDKEYGGGPRSVGLIRFIIDGRAVDTFHIHGSSGSLVRLLPNGPVTAKHFRLEMTRMTDGPSDSGPRIIEIDSVSVQSIESDASESSKP